MKLGERVKELRKKKGVTQQELAEVVGFHRSAIAKIESGEIASLKRETLNTMAKYFDVSPVYLLGIEDTEEQKEIKGKIVKALTDEVGQFDYTDEEIKEIVDYSKYLIARRKEK